MKDIAGLQLAGLQYETYDFLTAGLLRKMLEKWPEDAPVYYRINEDKPRRMQAAAVAYAVEYIPRERLKEYDMQKLDLVICVGHDCRSAVELLKRNEVHRMEADE